MNMIIQITTAIALILSIIVPFGCFFLGEKNKKRYKKSLIANCFMFFGVLLVATVVSFAGTASVQAAGSSADGLATGLGYLGAALVTGISGLGSGIAVASPALPDTFSHVWLYGIAVAVCSSFKTQITLYCLANSSAASIR